MPATLHGRVWTPHANSGTWFFEGGKNGREGGMKSGEGRIPSLKRRGGCASRKRREATKNQRRRRGQSKDAEATTPSAALWWPFGRYLLSRSHPSFSRRGYPLARNSFKASNSWPRLIHSF